jgi:hypothetical protein
MGSDRSGFWKRQRAAGLLAVLAVLTACGGGSITANPTLTPSPVPTKSGSTPTPTPSGSATASPTPSPTASPTATATPTMRPTATPTPVATPQCTTSTSVPPSGGKVTANAASGTISEAFASGSFTSTANVAFCYVPQSMLPAPLDRARMDHRSLKRGPAFTQGAGNTYVAAFETSFGGATLASPAAITASTDVVPTSIPAGSQLNIALYANGTYTDVGTAEAGSSGTFRSSIPTASLPNVDGPGLYLVYLPASGTTTARVNLGIALLADDGTAAQTNGIQLVQMEDRSGNALPTPTTTFFPIAGVADIDAQGLTPDAERGAVADGGGNVYFYSGIPQHAFAPAPALSVSSYGTDADSLVVLPRGDEAIAALDNGAPLIDISGIPSGNTVVANTIQPGPDTSGATSPGSRDGLVVSDDGNVLLARGAAAVDVFSIAQVAAHPGSTGQGTTSYDVSLATTLFDVPQKYFECGRDDMAISPADSSRALIAGYGSSQSDPEISLLTGLPGTPKVTTFHMHLPPVKHRKAMRRLSEPSTHRLPYALIPPADAPIYAIAIAPNGKTAYASTEAGIVTLTGVATGNLKQSGSIYAPDLPVPAGTSPSPCPLEAATTISVLPDGKYLVADLDCQLSQGTTNTTQGYGVLVTIPIGPNGGLGAPVGQLDYVVDPFSDELVAH